MTGTRHLAPPLWLTLTSKASALILKIAEAKEKETRPWTEPPERNRVELRLQTKGGPVWRWSGSATVRSLRWSRDRPGLSWRSWWTQTCRFKLVAFSPVTQVRIYGFESVSGTGAGPNRIRPSVPERQVLLVWRSEAKAPKRKRSRSKRDSDQRCRFWSRSPAQNTGEP